jgi:triphosphoribosyl-dephospho-CoA synthetase
MKTPVVLRDDYIMYLELHDAALWFHTDVHRWSQEVKKKYLEDLDLLQYLTNVSLLALVEEEDTKLAKFGRLTGWKVLKQIEVNDKKYDIYTRSI